jgi:tRNA(adenine34) deaminase
MDEKNSFLDVAGFAPFSIEKKSQEEKDLYFMKEALKEAKKAFEEDEVPVGSVLVFENKIISRGYNQVEILRDATAHAEMICLTSAMAHISDWRLLNTTLYTTLEPCIMCAGAIISSRVKRLVWAANDIRQGANGSFIDVFEKAHPIHKVDIETGILKEESAYLLQEFFRKKREHKKLALEDIRLDGF